MPQLKVDQADLERGIQTVHVEVDDSEDETMKKHGGRWFPAKLLLRKSKRPLTIYGKKLRLRRTTSSFSEVTISSQCSWFPTHQIFGEDQDFDKTVPTDNPYASSEAFSKDDQNSYLVPDRVIGRIPDMVLPP